MPTIKTEEDARNAVQKLATVFGKTYTALQNEWNAIEKHADEKLLKKAAKKFDSINNKGGVFIKF